MKTENPILGSFSFGEILDEILGKKNIIILWQICHKIINRLLLFEKLRIIIKKRQIKRETKKFEKVSIDNYDQ